MKSSDTGYGTPEFWTMTVVNIAAAVIAILSARGLVTPTEGELWVSLVQAIALPVALVVMGVVTRQYLEGQTRVREAKILAGMTE